MRGAHWHCRIAAMCSSWDGTDSKPRDRNCLPMRWSSSSISVAGRRMWPVSDRSARAEWASELAARRERMRCLLEQAGCDAGLVFGCDGHAEHFRYLTNFAPVLGDSWLIMDAGERCVLTFQWQI